MNDYRFLNKCRGTCEKRKNVHETNCIGINPRHDDCKHSKKYGFKTGFCPYYCPNEKEKNYSGTLCEIEGNQYMRRPFHELWYFVIFTILILLALSVIEGTLDYLFFFSKTVLMLSILIFIISWLGNFLYVKLKGNNLVAVVNDDGVYTPRLLLSWEKIKKVKTHYNIPTRHRSSTHIVILEFIMRVDDERSYTESVYIYFSTLKMRQQIKKYMKQRVL